MKTLVALLVSLLLLSAGCEKNDPLPSVMKEVVLTPKQKEVISSSNSFGFDFFKTVNSFQKEDANFMISPLSVSMALGMTRNGAAGSTLDSITSVLGFEGLSDSEVNSSYKYIIETFTNLDPKVKLSLANSIWYRNTFSVEDAFINTNKDFFNAQTSSLDFADPLAKDIINEWVSNNTNNLIPKIIEEIPPSMVMYLINAVYFKGQWRHQFDKQHTINKPFTTSSGENIEAPAMIIENSFPILSRTDFKAIELPYGQANFNMSVILPSAESSTDDIINQLSIENWNNWSENFIIATVNLQLPKFKFSYDERNMKEILYAMGMGIAFEPGVADFTRINKGGQLNISEVKHKTFIETNEEGTEAAAVTSVGVELTSVPEVNYFIVDRPFIFMISEKSTNTILFVGVVNNPLFD